MLWVVHEAVQEVANGEDEGEVTAGSKGVPCEKYIDDYNSEKDANSIAVFKNDVEPNLSNGSFDSRKYHMMSYHICQMCQMLQC